MFEKQRFEKKVSNNKELEEEVEKFILSGYKIKYRDSNSVLLKERTYGELPIHFVLYVFFLLLIALISVDAESYAAGMQYMMLIILYLPFAAVINVAYILYSMFFVNEFLIELNNKKLGSSKSMNKKKIL